MPRRFYRSERVVERTVRGKCVLVPLGRDAAIDCLYTLNATAARIWSLASDGRTEEQVVAALVQDYEVTEAAARADARRVLDALVAAGAVTAAPPAPPPGARPRGDPEPENPGEG